MKYIVFLSVLISQVAGANVGKVPMDWISPESQNLKSLSFLSQLDSAYNNVLEANVNLLKHIPDDSHKKWSLQSVKTEIAIEAGGTIGVMGVGGEAALELVWIKKQANGNKVSLHSDSEEVSVTESESIKITGEMTEDALRSEIDPIVDIAFRSRYFRRKKSLSRSLLKEALKFQKTIQELESAPAMGAWYPYKYQLELYISAEGKIVPVAVGSSIRLRLEWWRLQKKDPSPFVAPLLTPELSANAKFVMGLASDLSVVDEVSFDNGFRLNAMKAGVGTTVKGNLFFLKGKAKAVGSIFFKRDPRKVPEFLLPSLMDEVTTYTMIEDSVAAEVPRFGFRSGMKKAAKIAQFFSSRAKTKEEGRFELNVIEAEFELFSSGNIGIVSVEGQSLLTLFVTRNVNI